MALIFATTTLSEMKHIRELTCKCTNLTNSAGYGNCSNNDTSKLEICYVVRPSTSLDLMDSLLYGIDSSVGFHQYSKEACRVKDRTENNNDHKARQTLEDDSINENKTHQSLVDNNYS